MIRLDDKVVLVTGASRGIGVVLAEAIAAAGAKVIINYAGSKSAAEDLAKKISATGAEAIAVQADVSKPDDVKRLFDVSIEKFGRIDVLINNAGIMINKPIKDVTDEDFTKQFETNVRGVFNTLRESATRLADHGSIINFSTSSNRLMLPTYGVYVATKAAVEQLTRVFSKEIGARGINVNSVSPGPTNTDLFLNGKSEETIARLASQSVFNRIADPEDIVGVVLFLASDDAKWITAQNFGVNGGLA
jgi:3-oxoacyl-[acyl-carrier protein] reductase